MRYSSAILDPEVIEIPIRPDLIVRVHGIPWNFSEAEANKVSQVISAYANRRTQESESR